MRPKDFWENVFSSAKKNVSKPRMLLFLERQP
jgi:hypothetical protein